MARKNHKIDEVLQQLRNKNDVLVDGRVVKVLSDTVYDPKKDKTIASPWKRNDLGNGSWGKIDFLCNHCGYTQIFVAQF